MIAIIYGLNLIDIVPTKLSAINETMMKKVPEVQIASFTVENEAQELKQVIISQDAPSHYDRGENYLKHYRLESLYGEAVYLTENPDILRLTDGSILRRKKR